MTASSTSAYKNKTGLSDGTYTYRVYANDSAGNMNVTETRNITIDTTPPLVTTLNADPDPVEVYNLINVSVTVTDATIVDVVLIEIEQPNSIRTNYTVTRAGNTYYNDAINTTQLGIHTYRIYANDTSGNINDTESSTFIVQDTTNPILSLLLPENTTYNYNVSIPLNYTGWLL